MNKTVTVTGLCPADMMALLLKNTCKGFRLVDFDEDTPMVTVFNVIKMEGWNKINIDPDEKTISFSH